MARKLCYHFQTSYRNNGVRYKCIKNVLGENPHRNFTHIKKEKLQELEVLEFKGDIVLYYAGESLVCTNGYVPYGLQFKNEDVYVPLEKVLRLTTLI